MIMRIFVGKTSITSSDLNVHASWFIQTKTRRDQSGAFAFEGSQMAWCWLETSHFKYRVMYRTLMIIESFLFCIYSRAECASAFLSILQSSLLRNFYNNNFFVAGNLKWLCFRNRIIWNEDNFRLRQIVGPWNRDVACASWSRMIMVHMLLKCES